MTLKWTIRDGAWVQVAMALVRTPDGYREYACHASATLRRSEQS